MRITVGGSFAHATDGVDNADRVGGDGRGVIDRQFLPLFRSCALAGDLRANRSVAAGAGRAADFVPDGLVWRQDDDVGLRAGMVGDGMDKSEGAIDNHEQTQRSAAQPEEAISATVNLLQSYPDIRS